VDKPTLRISVTVVGAVIGIVLPCVAAVAAVATSGATSGVGVSHVQLRAKPVSHTPKKKPTPTTPPPTTAPPTTAPPTTPPPTTPPPTTPPPTTPPPTPGTCTDAVTFAGESYCPGFIVGVATGAYGTGTRIVVQSVTVWDVSGTHATIAGGPSCLPDPSGEPVFCGDIVPTLDVDFAAIPPPPAVGAVVNVYGTTTSTGGLSPAGYEVVGCDPTVGSC
jgi:hypothetical protein